MLGILEIQSHARTREPCDEVEAPITTTCNDFLVVMHGLLHLGNQGLQFFRRAVPRILLQFSAKMICMSWSSVISKIGVAGTFGSRLGAIPLRR